MREIPIGAIPLILGVWVLVTLMAIVRIATAIFSQRVRSQIQAHPLLHGLWAAAVVAGLVLAARPDWWIETVKMEQSPNQALQAIGAGAPQPER